MKFFIVGYMYSGKSTVGKQLAKMLKYDFVDTDVLFQNQYNTSISDYFSEHGEAKFREAERQILEDLRDYPNNVVISTGGGLPCFNNTMDLMRDMGIVIYLKASVNAIFRRFDRSLAQRPLLAGLSREEAIRKIETHLSEREAFYERANVTISAESVNYDALLQILSPFL